MCFGDLFLLLHHIASTHAISLQVVRVTMYFAEKPLIDAVEITPTKVSINSLDSNEKS